MIVRTLKCVLLHSGRKNLRNLMNLKCRNLNIMMYCSLSLHKLLDLKNTLINTQFMEQKCYKFRKWNRIQSRIFLNISFHFFNKNFEYYNLFIWCIFLRFTYFLKIILEILVKSQRNLFYYFYHVSGNSTQSVQF